ncbi:GlcNAc-PI de-N-acetylase [compost metagenome]
MDRLLLVMAHPDDAEIWAGGTLIQHSQRNDPIVICYMFPESEIRKSEAKKIEQFINAEIVFISDENREINLLEVILCFKPTIIISHWQDDPHYEHRMANNILGAVIHRARAIHKIYFTLFTCDTYFSKGTHLYQPFIPSHFIDISDVWNKKLEMIKVHRSQPLEKLLSMTEAQNKLHGLSIGTIYAEAFLQLPVLGILKRNDLYLTGYREKSKGAF